MTTGSTKTAGTSALPLFYREPAVLHSEAHAGWRLKEGDTAFAAGTPYVPIVLGEFGEAGCCYPVVFAGDTFLPVVVLGLADGENLFVEERAWANGHYVPAYVRRYPFGFVAIPGSDRFALALDTASERLVREGDDGMPLFEKGEPGPLTRQALQFCEAYQAEFQNTKAFADALQEQGLLVEKRADATLPDGRRYALDGFRIVDTDRLRDLDEATVVDWHRKGWLSLINLHLASLGRLTTLMERQASRKPPL
ncbi:SapC protein [Sphingobium faniae]|uniref:SapC family protein n=1 Tax=Rhizorhapis sp. SPR117 TaxID=2912611 RepID=UPI0008772B6A|nr:SapC family protein [Rhizorhapis sp. SPR117]SCW92651.1 SapC protein [Sphingobium faniae]